MYTNNVILNMYYNFDYIFQLHICILLLIVMYESQVYV